MMNYKEGTGKRIQFIREDLKLSLAGFGKILGLGKSAIHQYEQGVSAPKLDTLVKIADIGGTTLDWLITGEELPDGIKQALSPPPEVTRILEITKPLSNDELITGSKPNTGNGSLAGNTQQEPLSEMDKRVLAMFRNLDPREYGAVIEFLKTMAQTSQYPQRGNVDEKAED